MASRLLFVEQGKASAVELEWIAKSEKRWALMQMLLRHITSFAKHCVFKEITPENLLQLLEAMKLEYPRLRFGRIEVKFVASSGREKLYNTTFKNFVSLWRDNKAIIRNYSAYLSLVNMGGDALNDHVCFFVQQSLRNKAGAPDGHLALGAVGCYEHAFNHFVQTAAAVLSVELAPPPGSSWHRERLRERWKREHVDIELVTHVSGAIDAGQFDTALKAAIGVVESRLRQRCIAAGNAAAADQAGADLAVTAYHRDRGCLIPPWPVATEASHGTQLMFQGFFLYLRNAYMHNASVMGADESAVYDALATCEFLLKVIDGSTRR
jgi:hypothetical protein